MACTTSATFDNSGQDETDTFFGKSKVSFEF